MKKVWIKAKTFFDVHWEQMRIFIGVTLVAVLSFEVGVLSNFSHSAAPIVIEVSKGNEAAATGGPAPVDAVTTGTTTGSVVSQADVTKADCVFVGSRNSTLYHLPTCAVAKRIKAENRVCFASADDATKRGYKPGCIK